MMKIPYQKKGESPTMLIHCGTHGDEYGVIESVKMAIKKYDDRLPDYVFVPRVSPSAVAARTRNNAKDRDLNRVFLENSADEEVLANIQIMKKWQFERLVSFHEDSSKMNEFYLYDINDGIGESEGWKLFKNKVLGEGFELLNGVDDPNDPTLNYIFEDGYHLAIVFPEEYKVGSVDAWAMRSGLVKKSLIPEIPGQMNQSRKNKIVDLFFRHILL